ncbi:MAG TPA: HAD-IA family hydrolase [Kofleriaceae bacterium]|nr:HAD-IA family hydrolase [Kofleriaceae bacterium]
MTFDAGLTLIELDLDFLAQRLGEREIAVDVAALVASAPSAWLHYDALAPTSTHPWQDFMAKLLEGAGVPNVGPVVDWLWSQQPHKNLFRKPIAPMVELARDLSRRGITVAVLSNSEGRLRELLTEIGVADPFAAIIDSGLLEFAKPDPRIFAHTLAELGTPDAVPIHIGDSWTADIAAALAVGWRAIWYRSRGGIATGNASVPIAQNADEVRRALRDYGVL